MQAMSVTEPGGSLHPVERDPRSPGACEVCVEVVATGVCFADLGMAEAKSSSYGFPVTRATKSPDWSPRSAPRCPGGRSAPGS